MNAAAEETLASLRINRHASDSLIADYEAAADGTAGLTVAERYAKQKQDLLDNHGRNRHKVPIEVSTTPDGGVFVGGVIGPNRKEAVLLRSDLRRAGASSDRYEGGDCDQYEVLTFAPHAKSEWPALLHQALLNVGYVDVREVVIVWPGKPVEPPVVVSTNIDDFS